MENHVVTKKTIIETKKISNELTCNVISVFGEIRSYEVELLNENKNVLAIYKVSNNDDFFELKTVSGDDKYIPEIEEALYERLKDCHQWLKDDFNAEIDTIKFYLQKLSAEGLTTLGSADYDASVEALNFFFGPGTPESNDFMTGCGFEKEDYTDEEYEEYLESCDDYNSRIVSKAKEKAEEMIKELEKKYGFDCEM